MTKRRHLTPFIGQPTPGLPTRRAGGARREVSDRVEFVQGERTLTGWALNSSRGGVRAILEEPVELGEQFKVSVGDAPPRAGKIVWIQEEPDGMIVGVSFLDDATGSVPPQPEPGGGDAPAEPSEGGAT